MSTKESIATRGENEIELDLPAEKPILITKDGKPTGVYYPIGDPQRLPDDVRRDLIRLLSESLRAQSDAAGITITDEQILADIKEFRRRRRGR
ncbi:hypothetical protein K8I61_14275 [bacterium]|nr:hypothetical protein [bacterium]